MRVGVTVGVGVRVGGTVGVSVGAGEGVAVATGVKVAVAGTTRDLVSENIGINGVAVTLVDTAGWHATDDAVEREGITRSEQARAVAHLIVVVLDRSEPLRSEDEELLAQTAGRPRIIVANKSDLPASWLMPPPNGVVEVSARTGGGVDELRCAIVAALAGHESLRDTAAVSNSRHIALLEYARVSLVAAADASAVTGTPEEFVLADLQAARANLDEVVGTRTSDDLLRHIFERFCIGK